MIHHIIIVVVVALQGGRKGVMMIVFSFFFPLWKQTRISSGNFTDFIPLTSGVLSVVKNTAFLLSGISPNGCNLIYTSKKKQKEKTRKITNNNITISRNPTTLAPTAKGRRTNAVEILRGRRIDSKINK